MLSEKQLKKIEAHIEIIARVAHGVNRAFCQAIGDFSQPTWDEAEDWQRESAINGVKFHKDNPDAGPGASHENWMTEKLDDGWVRGDEKDTEKKTHPCLVPFDDLPQEQKVKDYLFIGVCETCLNI